MDSHQFVRVSFVPKPTSVRWLNKIEPMNNQQQYTNSRIPMDQDTSSYVSSMTSNNIESSSNNSQTNINVKAANNNHKTKPLNTCLIMVGLLLTFISLAAMILSIYSLVIIDQMSTTDNVTTTTTPTTAMQKIAPPNETVYGIWNTVAGGSSTAATAGGSTGNYPPVENPQNIFDKNTTTKYLSFGDQSAANGYGLNTGFYFTALQGPTILIAIQFATGTGCGGRDPLAVTIEGSNSANLTVGSSWTLIDNNVSTGLQSILNCSTYGTVQTMSNTVAYASYRVLVTSKRDSSASSNSVEYSEVVMFQRVA